MKPIVYFLAIMTLGIFSCDDVDDEPQNEPSFVSANLNEESWTGVPEISINNDNDTLTFLGISNEQVVVFKIKFNGTAIYDLLGNQAFYYTTVGGDAITSEYILDLNSPSEVTITAYDSDQSIMEGSFAIALSQKWSNPENTTEMLRFTNGQFKGTISK